MIRSPRLRAVMAALTLGICLVLIPAVQARAIERELAGVRIFSPVSVILKRFGDPAFITPGTSYAPITFTPGQPLLIAPGDTANPAAGQPPVVQPMTPGQSATQDDFNILYPSASRYYYNLAVKGLTFEFVVSADGRVIAIKAIGYRGAIRTTKGIGLGDTYAQVVEKYGYPESTVSEQGADGAILTISYLQRDHVVFRIARNMVSVISVSAPD